MAHAAILVAQQRIIARMMQHGFNLSDVTGNDHGAHVGHRNMDAVNHIQTDPAESNVGFCRQNEIGGIKAVTSGHDAYRDSAVGILLNAELVLGKFFG